MTQKLIQGAARTVTAAVITSLALLVMSLPDILVNLIFGLSA
ncbi:hypothetical protein [Paenarthrobacter sp. Y-19]|nr:hypothetical protein [Paenarthrobacter sp. Y-19]